MPVHILVIDDDAAIRISLSLLLEAKGFNVSLAIDGADGLSKYLKEKPDIVISDLIMPGHQGIQTISRIRAEDPSLPIIAMSGSVQGGATSFLKKALAAGADHCLEKPFDAMELLNMLNRIESR